MIKLIKEAHNEISELLYEVNIVIYYFRRNNFDRALRTSRLVIDRISSLLGNIMMQETYLSHYVIETGDNMQMMFENIMASQQQNDYILLADLYELQVASWLRGMQELIVSNEIVKLDFDVLEKNRKSISAKAPDLSKLLCNLTLEHAKEKGYELEFTTTGEKTLSRNVNGSVHYFHSNVSPKFEGFHLADSWFNIDKEHYYIYGLGLGYEVLELLKRNQFVDVTVLESDLDILYLALGTNDFSGYIEENRLTIIHDSNCEAISSVLSKVKEDSEFIVHAPSMKNMQNHTIRELIENYFLQYYSMKNQHELLLGNYKRNVRRQDSSVEDLRSQFEDKTIFIVAAGPSLDNNFKLLKSVKDGVILATGTVFKKLLKEGIEPNYVIVTDANNRVYGQIRGIEDAPIPMIYLSTANYKFAENYKAKKYIAFQYGMEPAEEYAKENNHLLFETGGSVTTTALDISLRLGCKKVVFVGLDLAYPNGYVHAEGTSLRKLAVEDNLRTVTDVFGNEIKTSKNLSIYRKWIEERIKKSSDVEFIDATEGGARILGTSVVKLKDLLWESDEK